MDDPARHAWKQQALHELLAGLGRIDLLASEPNRTTLISLIEAELRIEQPSATLSVSRNPVSRLDLLALTRECLAVRGGVASLRAAVHTMFGPTGRDLLSACDRILTAEPGILGDQDRAGLRDVLEGIALTGHTDVPALFVEATRPVPVATTVSTVDGAIRQLERRGTAVPLMRFLALLAGHSTQNSAAAALRSWVGARLDLVPGHRRDEVARLLGGGRRRTGGEGARTCLLIRVEPVEDDTYSVMAWLGQTDAPYGPNEGPEDVVTLDELRQWLRACIRRYRHGALHPERRPLIEFALPPSHLNAPVDAWELDDGNRLGVLYQVTVRPLTRPEPARALLADRWKALVAGAGAGQAAPAAARWLTESPATVTPATSAWSWIAVTCPLVGHRPAAVDALLATGTPVAAWLRGDQTPTARRTVLEGLSNGRLVTHFPGAVRKFREIGWTDETDESDLVLLWDDPTRQMPASYLVNAPERRT